MAESEHRLLTLEGAGVAYPAGGVFFRRQHWALKDVSLTLDDGEVLGVIGRNGAGKSTLLRLLAGIMAPDAGRVWHRPGCRASLLALQVGFVPELTGVENAELSCVLLGMTRRAARAALPDIEAFAEIGASIREPVNTYSSGMRARLGFGVALAARPDILLIDEVLGVGDAPFRQKSSAMLRERIRNGQSAIIVSHSLGVIKNLCHRAVVIDNGQTLLGGPAHEVVAQYREMMGEAGAKRPAKV